MTSWKPPPTKQELQNTVDRFAGFLRAIPCAGAGKPTCKRDTGEAREGRE